jgi:predicted small integral membrane protein
VIAAFGCLFLAIALGCAAMSPPLGCLIGPKPRWAVIVLMIGAGAIFGIGATSILFFAADLLTPGFRWVELAVEIAALAWLVYASIQSRKMEQAEAEPVRTPGTKAGSKLESKLQSSPKSPSSKSPDPKSRSPKSKVRGPWNLLVAGAVLVVLLLATSAMSQAWDRNPQGNWDAWSIWNLRAKFLAPSGGEPGVAKSTMAARAWSPLLTGTHPEYPLLLSGAVARCWGLSLSGPVASDAAPDSVPIAIGYLFFLSLIAVVTGGLAIARGAVAGLIAGLTLAATGALLHEVPSQYADVPLAAYLACTVVFLVIDRPVWAGVFAGFAAWTKDEGAMFCVVLVVLLAGISVWDRPRRRDLPRVILGMLPGGLTFGLFKVFLAAHGTAQFSAGALSRFANAGRWEVVLAGVGSQIASLGEGWLHPVLIVAAFAIGVGFRADSRRDSYFPALLCTALAVAMLGGYCVAMVTSSDDAAWQTSTAAGRLIVQWWPLAVIAMMLWLRPAEELAVEEPSARKKSQ